MSHEPECDDFQNDNVDGLCICQRLRESYKRGREDAAKAVGDAYYMDYDLTGFIVVAKAAARGGEQN